MERKNPQINEVTLLGVAFIRLGPGTFHLRLDYRL